MSETLQTVILGLVQGLCEFLPVSSSGHLALLQKFFNFDAAIVLAFDLLLHCATVLVVIIFFRREIFKLIIHWLGGLVSANERERGEWLYGWYIIAATILTGFIGLSLKNFVEQAMASPLYVGCGLLVTGGFIALVPLMAERKGLLSFKAAILIGIVQGLAVFPGLSRSGSTIAAALLLGVSVHEAFRFSFLISVPAVLGASLLEILKLLKEFNFNLSAAAATLPSGTLYAVLIAFISGWIALRLIRSLVLSGRWAYFSLYCLILGSAAILLSLEIF
ncbi:MAG: undecaprenyl-diphosphate phosphatase [Synergistaceae bacterium]|nr:undecaprenyl-diphosphate phosphatase [Synergistaceae bacterium]